MIVGQPCRSRWRVWLSRRIGIPRTTHMPWEFRGQCSDCGHEWVAVESFFRAGDIDFKTPGTHRSYFCPKCCDQLSVPCLVDANSWRRWLTAHAIDVRNSALLKLACDGISAILSGVRTIYSPTLIDIGPLHCPECNERMNPGSVDEGPILCPACGSRTARSLGAYAHVIIVREPSNPPLAEGT